MSRKMLLSTRESVNGKSIVEELGIVSGSAVKSRMFFRDIVANIRDFLGWEVKEYSKLIADTEKIAIERMCLEAEKLGANAILCVRLVPTEVKANCAEIIAFGTAVVVE